MSQFVLLEHDHPALHWDFMLEHAGALWTWRLEEMPGDISAEIAATRLPDHRIEYLDYEGPVSNNRGKVHRIDRGTYVNTAAEDSSELNADVIEIRIHGGHLQGTARLQSTNSESWTFCWNPDNNED